MRKSRGMPFSSWLNGSPLGVRDLIKVIPLSVLSEGYLNNLTLKETEEHYNEKRYGNSN
tara:strand:+ start:922 stop:1098 length:177 start_codon:yes stop_codon:yes gene_type:complete